MSSLSIEPPSAPGPTPDSPRRTPEVARSRGRWIAAGVVLVLAMLAAVVALKPGFLRSGSGASVGATPSSTPASRGTLARTVRIGGTVGAVRYVNISAPALRGQGGQLTVVQVAPAGSRVQKDDVLAEFDRQTQMSNFMDREADFISLTDQIAKRRSELDIEREKQRSDLQKAHADVDAARLENQRNEVVSKIDAEKNRQLLAEAEATLKMQEQTLKLRQASAEAELRVLEIQRERQRLQMEHARFNYERLIVRSPIAGLVVLTPFWKGSQMGVVQEGDQVRPAAIFMQVVDPTAMVVKARANQLDAALLQPGAKAIVRLDAYPDLQFPGRVESVGALAQAMGWSDKVKTFPAIFSVQGSDPRLIPDISASVEVELEQEPHAARPTEPVSGPPTQEPVKSGTAAKPSKAKLRQPGVTGGDR